MQIQSLLNNRLKEENREKDKEDLLKVGLLRAGSAAFLLNDGTVSSAGNCVRTSRLRFNGFQPVEGHKLNKLWMFKGGVASEQVIAELLTGAGHTVIRDSEYRLTLQSGGVISGRPDILIAKAGSTEPVLGLELKKVSSAWTAKEVFNNGKPKADHLCQAILYSQMVGVPYKLVYVQYDNYPAFTMRDLPAESSNVDRDDKGKPINLVPFAKVYDVRLSDSGRVEYKSEDKASWNSTIISWQAILDYYGQIFSLTDEMPLPSLPENYDPDGEQENYRPCKYCSFAKVCQSQKELTFGEWQERLIKEGLIKNG